jgi:membrane-bound serine protease (ClpP class)
VLFIIGALLLLVEIFLIPGFGLTGISGITFMLIAIFFSMAAPLPEAPSFAIPAIDLQRAILQSALACVFTLGAGAFVTRYLPEAAGFRRLVLETALNGRANDPQAAPGHNTSQEYSPATGDKGITVTALRPAGYATINGKRFGVVAQGSFLETGTPVSVVSAQGNHIVVATEIARKDVNA